MFLVWRAERTYLCTRSANKNVFVYLVWVSLKCTMPQKYVLGVVRQTNIRLYQKCQQECLWIPHMDVFEMHNAKKGVFLVWRAKRTYVYTKKYHKKCIWIPSMGVFEMDAAKKCVFFGVAR